MKVQVILPLTIVISVALVGLMRMRKKEHDKEDKRNRFEDIKLRVTNDVLGEYQNEYSENQNLLGKIQNEHKQLEEEMNMLQTKGDKAKGEADICQGGQKTAKDDLAKAELEMNNLRAESEKEQTNWKKELTMLQQQLAERSPLCNFLKTGSEAASNLCGKEVVKEAPKQEVPKAEAPKQEVPKAEAPKPEEPKAEAPKPEEPKAEAPKPEKPKAEAPKPEEPKAEAPKQEEPKGEAPKPEEQKAEAPKPEEPKAEAPKKR